MPDEDGAHIHLKNPDITTEPPHPGARPFAPLRIKNYRLLLTGTVLSNAARWIQQVTLNWLVYHLTGSGTILGSFSLVRGLASLGIVPLAGILIERSSRRKLMVAINSWLFVITLGLGLLLILGYARAWHLFIFVFLLAVALSLDMNLRQVVVFDLVPRPMVPNAVAFIQTGWSLMRSFGPGIGGYLILWFGPAGNFFIQAGAYALIAITIVRIQFPERETAPRGSQLQIVLEGVRYVLRGRTTRIFMLMGIVLPLLIIPIYTILPPIYAVEVFGDDSGRVLGLLMACVGVGGIFGGIFTASLGRVERRGLVQLICLLLLSLSLIGFALSRTLWLALMLLSFSGFFEMIFLTTNQTLLQLSIPDNLRGRVTSLVNLNLAIHPLGGMIAGLGSDLLGGPRAITILLAGLAACVAVGVFLFSKTIRNYRLSNAIASD